MFEIMPSLKIGIESASRTGTSGSAYYSAMKLVIWIILIADIATGMTYGKSYESSEGKVVHPDDVRAARILRKLLENGADADRPDRGYTPLHVAAESNKLLNAAVLLEYGAGIYTKTHDGLTALHLAVQEGHAGMAALLLGIGINPNVRAIENGFTPLHLCAQKGTVEVAAVLAEYGSEFYARAYDGSTPLEVASLSGNRNVVKFLLHYYDNSNTQKADKYEKSVDEQEANAQKKVLEQIKDFNESQKELLKQMGDFKESQKEVLKQMRDTEAIQKEFLKQIRDLKESQKKLREQRIEL